MIAHRILMRCGWMLVGVLLYKHAWGGAFMLAACTLAVECLYEFRK